jgi:tRNA A-37 threonylcarbamoyl transferase component Bud32
MFAPMTEDRVPVPKVKVTEPETTVTLDVTDPFAAGAFDSYLSGAVTQGGGTLASLANETEILRRNRLLAAALFLAATFGVLMVWVFVSDNPGTLSVAGSRFSLRVGLIGLRCLLAMFVAGLLASNVVLSSKQLRVVEYVLFLGVTLIMMATQYFVGRELMSRGPVFAPIILAFGKDGVIQMLVLMMIYGTLIPNSPDTAARVLVLMFAGPVAGAFLLSLNPRNAHVVKELGSAEESGSNILFLAIGTALAIYGSFLVNRLRTQLHQARKFGQYRLIRKLGEGGMGEVYLAEHQLLKRPCALKLIKAEAGSDPIALARFEREVRSAARLAHPNTIEIFDYGHTEDGTFYYVMEYLAGLSLAELVEQAGPLPAGRVIHLFRQVCAGLAQAHALGLVHRDLKPANLFVAVRGGESDVAKVLDFGLVKVTKDPEAATLSSDMTISGTPMYMAPEQAVGDRSLDARADIYALGAMLYYALTGQPPFTGTSAFLVMMAHARDPAVPPSQVHPGIPEDLERVVLCCLAKKPGDRYSTVKVLGAALGACTSAAEWGPSRADAWWAAASFMSGDEPPEAPAGDETHQSV